MPTAVCPKCGTTIRFEGVAGLCPKCGSVVRVALKRDAGAAAPPPSQAASASKGRRKSAPDLEGLDAGAQEQFTPAGSPGAKAPPDPIIFYLAVGSGVVIVLFGLYFLLSTLLFRPPQFTPPPVAAAPVVSAPVSAPPPPIVETAQVPVVPPPATAPVTLARPATSGPAWMALKPVKPALKAKRITDALVEAAIKKAVVYLKSQFADGQLVQPSSSDLYSGQDAICVYALLQAGLAVDDSQLSSSDPFMQDLLDHLKKFEMNKDLATYGRSLRASALSIFDRDADQTQLDKDRQWLLASQLGGKYSYGMPAPNTTAENAPWDNSNGQYGVLGIWAAAQAGMSVPDKYWTDVEQHWLDCQDPDGGWGYNTGGGDSKLTMTCAGVTTLCVTAEQLELIASKGKKDARPRMSKAIASALDFMGKGDSLTSFIGQWTNEGYTLYGVERAALATGYRWFGNHDWYRELGGEEIARQAPNGSWDGNSGSIVETAFRILFLSRGRQPILMNKLRFNGDWNDRPRDVAKLAQFASAQLEKPFAWGVADLSRDWWDWLESPVLMISTDAAPNFTDEECAKLRSYTDAGGLIFFHNEYGSKEIDSFFKDFAKRVYPEYPATKVAADDLIYSADFPMKVKPELQEIGNGSRIFMIYSPRDVTQDWVRFRPKDNHQNPNLQLGINLFVTASGKSNFRNRLSSPYEPEPDFAAIGTLPVLQITYPGAWNPEPKAYEQFSRWFQNQTSIKLDVLPTPMTSLSSKQSPVAVLTGNARVDFSRMDLHALHDFVQQGGVLVIDSTGGNKAFAGSVHDFLLPNAFPGIHPSPIPTADPILSGTAPCTDALPKARLRNFASMLVSNGIIPTVRYAQVGQGTVIVSDLDVTTGLLNSGTYGINGYTPAYCQSLMKNVILWALSRYSHA